MKNIYSVILSGVICLFGTVSCVNEEADIFDLSPAERLNKVISDYTDLLASAENGWVMEYFPTEDTEGYTYLMKFGTGGEVTIAGNNKWLGNKYREETSLFNVLTDNGPVLSLSSYNKIFHLFAFPADPNGQDKDLQGLGLQGDYEFVIMKSADDMLEMRGKKRDTYIRMYKLPADVSWTDYMDKVKEMDATLFGMEDVPLFLKIGNETYEAHNGPKHIFSFLFPGEDLIAEGRKFPFVVTVEGLRLYKPFESNGITVQNFNLPANKDKLIALDNGVESYIEGPSIASFLDESFSIYKINENMVSEDIKQIIEKLKKQLIAAYSSHTLTFVGISQNKSFNKHTLYIKTAKTVAEYAIEFTPVEGKVDELTLSLIEGEPICDSNCKLYINKGVTAIEELARSLQGTYSLSTVNPFTIKSVKYSNTTNSGHFFMVER